MPQTDLGVFLFVGAIFFLIGILGGGFEISAIKIPAVGKIPRIISTVLGIVLMGTALFKITSTSSPQSESVAPTTAPIQSSTQTNSNQYRILLDTYHGSTLPIENISNKFIVKEATTSITSDVLSDYKVLVINFAKYGNKPQYTTQEILDIRDFIQKGGNVLLVGLGWVWVGENSSIADYPLNSIAKDSGIFFTDRYIDNVGGVNQKINPIIFHQPFIINNSITQGVSQIGAAQSVPGSLDVESPAVALISGDNDTQDSGGYKNPVILASSTLGNGKIICLQHSNYLIPYVDKYNDNKYSPSDFDNSKLLENIITWLANN